MRRLIIFYLVSITSGLMAQSARPRTAAAAKPIDAQGALSPASLHTDDLNYGDDVKRIYIGDFAHVRFARDSAETSLLTDKYMVDYADQCGASLPKNKVEIMKQECAREVWSVNGYGEVPGSRHCADYRTVGTGTYADPAVYELQKHLDGELAGKMLGNMFSELKSGDGGGDMRRMTDVAVYVAADMTKLLEENGCGSPRTMRFQANLIRFGWGKEPIVMAGGASALASSEAAKTGPMKAQNYKALVDNLIADESKAWMMNRYEAGSARTSRVTLDAQGRPSEVDAGYSYLMMGQSTVGSVRVTFRNGTPECMYFSDFPSTCRAPSPRVISAYEGNQFAE